MLKFKKLSLFTMITFSALALNGCDLSENYLKADREGGLEVQDYRDAFASRIDDELTDEEVRKSSSVPKLQAYISDGALSAKPMPLVSISVNQSVPLKDVLYELADQAKVDIELDPRISGAIIFTARQRPFDDVIERISEIAGLRYNLENNILRVQIDNPYNKLYKIDYLNFIRTTSSSISNDVSVVSGDGTDTGSSFTSDSTGESNFWGELEANLQQIIGGRMSGALKTASNPVISVAEQNPNVQAVSPVDANGNVQVSAPQATINVSSENADDDRGGTEEEDLPTFSINKQAGLINLYANDKTQKEVAEYLRELKRLSTAQVLIEAKILEVSLFDEYATGVDWSVVDITGESTLDFLSAGTSRLGDTAASLVSDVAAGLTGTQIATTRSFVAGYEGNDISALIRAISGFGTVKALASPRLTVLNNQAAVMNVADNRVFFDIDIDVTTEEGVTTTDVSSDILNVPEGILVNVQPSIDLDRKTVSLSLRPTVTRVVSSQSDPAVQFITASNGIEGVESLIPELNVQEIDSVIMVRSGQAAILGGLLQDRVETIQSAVPVLGEVPMVGALFRDSNDSISKTELVIFLKATILDGAGQAIDNTDKDFYRQFSSDRRPFRF